MSYCRYAVAQRFVYSWKWTSNPNLQLMAITMKVAQPSAENVYSSVQKLIFVPFSSHSERMQVFPPVAARIENFPPGRTNRDFSLLLSTTRMDYTTLRDPVLTFERYNSKEKPLNYNSVNSEWAHNVQEPSCNHIGLSFLRNGLSSVEYFKFAKSINCCARKQLNPWNVGKGT